MKPSGKSAKQLILMRHAKSDWGSNVSADHDRPLNQRGRHAANDMAHWIAAEIGVPDRILCSSARRTRETVERLTACWSCPVDVHFAASLYLAPANEIMHQIAALGGEAQRLLVVAHNPGLETLVNQLSHRLEPFPTAAVAAFLVPPNLAWTALHANMALELLHLQRPKEL